MNNLKKFAAVGVLAMAIAGAGCNVFRGESTPGEYVDDVAITSKVKTELLDSHRVDGLDVNVDSTNGKVTLRGWASNPEESRKAAEIARSVKGVKSVDNQLKIKS